VLAKVLLAVDDSFSTLGVASPSAEPFASDALSVGIPEMRVSKFKFSSASFFIALACRAVNSSAICARRSASSHLCGNNDTKVKARLKLVQANILIVLPIPAARLLSFSALHT